MWNNITAPNTSTVGGNGVFPAVFSVLVACLPFLYQYASPIPVLSLGEMLLLPFIFFYFMLDLKHGIKLCNYCGFYYLMLLVVVMNLLALMIQPYAAFQKSATVLLRLIYYSLLIYVGYRRINSQHIAHDFNCGGCGKQPVYYRTVRFSHGVWI